MVRGNQSGGPTVMVVEDFEVTRELLRMMLQRKGCRVVEATTGREAVEVAARERPDLILMDLSLPVMDGVAATRQIRAGGATAGTPVVAFSAHCDDAEWRQRAFDAGCVECVGKPVDPETINRLVDRYGPRQPSSEGN